MTDGEILAFVKKTHELWRPMREAAQARKAATKQRAPARRGGLSDLLSQGEGMARWLNEQPELKGIALLIDNLRTYDSLCKEWLKKSRRDVRGLKELIDRLHDRHGYLFDQLWKKSRKWMPHELAALHDKLCKQVKRYDSRWFPLPGVALGRGPLNKIRLIEARAFDTIVRLIEHDEFARLRRCSYEKCGKWFFAGQRSDKRKCNAACRNAAFEDTEERKEQKRKNASRYYYDNYAGTRLDRKRRKR